MNLNIFEAIILGIFQGISEFLPISSSGHLVLLNHLFGIKEGTIFSTAMFHFGTFLSIIIVYFKDIINIIKETIYMIIDFIKYKKLKIDNRYRILSIMIIAASIPTALLYILFDDFFENLYGSLLSVGIAFIITGIILVIAEKGVEGKRNVYDLKVRDAIFIGIFQGFAIAPGISRSGSTIVGGLFRKLNKKVATKLSFFIALPAIFGASLLQFLEVFSGESNLEITVPIIIGTIFSAITGILAIKFLINLLQKGKLYYFSIYLWIIGLIIIVSNFV